MLEQDMLKRLRVIVKEAGGQKAFGELCGVKQNTISDILTGKHEPNMALLSVVIFNLHYSIDWLFTGKGRPKLGVNRRESPEGIYTHVMGQLKAAQLQLAGVAAKMQAYEKEIATLKASHPAEQ